MTLNTQLLTMVSMILSGFYLGIAITTFRRFASSWQNNVFLVYFLEICFWLSQTFIIFYVLYRVNAGELSVYIFLAGLLGFSIYRVFAISFYSKLLDNVIRIIISIYQFLSKVLYYTIYVPIKSLITVSIAVILFTLRVVWKVISYLVKVVRLLIYSIGKFIYLLLPDNIQKKINKLAGICSIIKNKYILALSYFKRR